MKYIKLNTLQEAEEEYEALYQYLKENHYMPSRDREELYKQVTHVSDIIKKFKSGESNGGS